MRPIKFSIIIPVYNVESYLANCLNSIFSQTYSNFEVIAVNDGSKDKSGQILEQYQQTEKEKLKVIHQPNQGVSVARNQAIAAATGDYLVFVDSDDYIDPDLLSTLLPFLSTNPDILKYSFSKVEEKKILKHHAQVFACCTGQEAFSFLTKDDLFDVVWLYAISRTYWQRNHYLFPAGLLHEDFGLIPLVIRNADTVQSIDYHGYYYVVRPESIITTKEQEKNYQKACDNLKHYDFLIGHYPEDPIYQSFVANAVLQKAKELKGDYQKEYIKALQKRKIYDHILKDSWARKIKWYLMKMNLTFYVKYFM